MTDDETPATEAERTQLIAGMYHTMRGKKRRDLGADKIMEAMLERVRKESERGKGR